MATEKQKRLQSAAMKTGYTINTLGEGKASRAENNIRQVEEQDSPSTVLCMRDIAVDTFPLDVFV